MRENCTPVSTSRSDLAVAPVGAVAASSHQTPCSKVVILMVSEEDPDAGGKQYESLSVSALTLVCRNCSFIRSHGMAEDSSERH